MRMVYEAKAPTEGLHLVAGPWRKIEVDHAGTKVAAFVYPEDVAVTAAAKLLKRSLKWLLAPSNSHSSSSLSGTES